MKQYLSPPKGFEPPQGTQPGAEFDASIRAKLDPDGRICVVSINGTPLEKEGPAEDKGEDEDTEMPMKPGEKMSLMGAAMKDGY